MNRLRQIRERKSLSLAQVSARTSIPIRLLTEYEQGQAEITQQHLKALSKALWVKPEELLLPAAGEGAAPAVGAPQAEAAAHAEPREDDPGVAHQPQVYAPRQFTPAAPAPGQYVPPQGPRPQAPTAPPRPAAAGAAFVPDGPRPAPRGRGRREPVPLPATEGQITEIMRLAARLNLSTDQLTEKFSRSISDLSRFDAREWIKTLREDAMTKAPPAKVHFGNWPGLKDDLEAVYLNQLRSEDSRIAVTLFNGQVFQGRIADFTPYTITVDTGDGSPVVLRKLAIAYYRSLGGGPEGGAEGESAGEEREVAPFPGPAAPTFAQPSSNGSSADHPPSGSGGGDES